MTAASTKNKDVLIDSQGYNYTRKCNKKNKAYWRCTVRNKTMNCRATIIQHGDEFKKGIYEHCHGPNPGTRTARKISKLVRNYAFLNIAVLILLLLLIFYYYYYVVKIYSNSTIKAIINPYYHLQLHPPTPRTLLTDILVIILRFCPNTSIQCIVILKGNKCGVDSLFNVYLS